MTRYIAVALAALAFGGVTEAMGAKQSPTKIAKKALAISKDVRHDQEVQITQVDKRLDGQDAQNADTHREVQTANGRVTTLEAQLQTKATHEHDTLGQVAPDTKGTVTAACQPDEFLRSGGYEFDTNQGITIPQPVVTGERAVGSSWVVTLNNIGGLTTVGLRVYANCLER